MGQAPLGVAALVLEEVQDREENVCVQNVERLLLMKQERRATL